MITKNSTVNKIMLGLGIPISLAILMFCFNTTYSHVLCNIETAELAKSNLAALNQYQSIPEQLGKLQKSIDDLYKEVTTIQGIAKVGNFGRDEGYIQINISGKASRYAKEGKARITNISNEAHPSYILPVKGTFSDSNTECIIRVSEKAARDMFEVTGSSFRAQIEKGT